tara:strand:- start:791 stop:1354 length:564 start_codon:yes stop_codon:yes gene_type:complete
MSAFDNYGEDIGGQSYSSYSETPGDSGGGSDGPRTLTDPTKGFDIAPPPSERLSLLDRIKDFGGNVLGGITSLALGLTPQNLIASQFLPTVISSVRDRFFPTYKTGINTIELDDRFTVPQTKPGIIGIDIPNFDPDMNLYADASLKNQNRQILENIFNPDLKIDEALDKEDIKRNREREILNQILTG